jgi:hypothetical protein
MLLSILLAVSLPPARQASVHCRDSSAETGASQMQPLHGPGGVTAVLKVSAADGQNCLAVPMPLLWCDGAHGLTALPPSDNHSNRLQFALRLARRPGTGVAGTRVWQKLSAGIAVRAC